MTVSQTFDPNETYAIFEHPQNGYREAVPTSAWAFTLLFGGGYLAYRQLWGHFAVSVLITAALMLAFSSIGILGIVMTNVLYAGKVRDLMMINYLQRGWSQVPVDQPSGL